MPPRIAQHRRAFALHDLKALDDTAGTFSGYLAVFSNEDLGGDVIEPGAFAKTLNDARERKATHNGAYLFPILYQHNEQAPCGGFIDAHEDGHGLYVKGQLDLDTTLGRETYSGLKKGYLSGLSIGYSAVKHKWVGDVRHLQELALYEGSVVTFPMNPEAQVSAVKAATDDDKQAQEARSKKYGIGIKDGGAVTKPSEWDSLTDADFGDPVNYRYPMPDKGHADNAAARFATPDARADYTTKEQDIIAKRIMKKQEGYGEKPDWWPLSDSGDNGKSAQQQQPVRKARDFNTLFQSLNAADDLQDEWGDTFIAFTHAMSELMWQVQAQANGWIPDGMPQVDAQEAAQANLDAFSKQVLDLVQRSAAASFAPSLDDDGDQFLDPDGCNAGDDDAMGYGMMSAGSLVEDVKAFRARKESKATKEGRAISAGNHQMMRQAVDMIGMGHKALSQFLADNDPAVNDPTTASTSRTTTDAGKGDANDLNNPGNIPPVATDNIYDPGFGKRRKPSYFHDAPRAGAQPAHRGATTLTASFTTRAGAHDVTGGKATTHDGADTTTTTADTSDDVARFRALMASIRQGAQQQQQQQQQSVRQ